MKPSGPTRHEPLGLIICSKSTWEPSVRREHALARQAASHAHPVTFVERPADLRALRRPGRRAWLAGLRAGERPRPAEPGIARIVRATPLPGHRGGLAAATNTLQLRSVLRRLDSEQATIVCCWPWDWPAVQATPAARRVFDIADDWGELMPGRRRRFEALYRRIAQTADEIIVVSEVLGARFPGRRVHVVRNATDRELLARPRGLTQSRTMVYVGTLTPRFDHALVLNVLRRLPDWRLELVGGCQYPGHEDAPPPQIQRLLALDGRVRWHGPRERQDAAAELDRATVAIVPNRPEHSLGQDSMKLYDYAARGLPIVSTHSLDGHVPSRPPALSLASDAATFAAAVRTAAEQSARTRADQRRWAAANTWEERYPAWAEAAFGAQH